MVLIAILGVLLFLAVWQNINNRNKWIKPTKPFPLKWKTILTKQVSFYNSLSKDEQLIFEYRVQEFLLNCRITGVETTVLLSDKLLVASSAIIPIFGFKHWKYVNISEVILYPSTFNQQFETVGNNRRILGMVGNGYMEGKMILSIKALRKGFANESDKKNTAIHEFVHLIDKTDGYIDGVPLALLEKQYAIPWIDLMNQKIDEIFEGKTDINPYGGTNRAEFFSVTSEYFFERPKLLEKKHPKLYALLEEIFDLDMAQRNLYIKNVKIGRNSLCPCNSGFKFKKCCG